MWYKFRILIRYITGKIFYGLLTLFGVVSVIFLLFSVLPGDPARMMLDQREDSAQLEAIRHKYGFDKPLPLQYVYYLNDLSPLSLHSNNESDYTYLKPQKYSYFRLFRLANYTMVFKYPYLRTSFQKNGQKVSSIIADTLTDTAIVGVAEISSAFFMLII